MPTLPEFLVQLQFITQETALLGLFLTAGIILVGRDWRFLILALLTQYILVGLILSRLMRPDIATLKVMIGAFICPILFLSARQITVSRPLLLPLDENNKRSHWQKLASILLSLLIGKQRYYRASPTGFVFRLLAALLMILVAVTLSNTFVLPGLSSSVTIAVYWLVLAGLVTLILTEEPLKVGCGLFTILLGFDLFYTTLEGSLLITGLWGAVNLLIALALSYLIVARGAGPEEEG
jgi:hypothetical protein